MVRVLDRAEFGRLFTEHARVLWVVAASLVPRGAVEDVLQDAAAVALARLDDFDAESSFRAWMIQIVRYAAANARRRARRQDGASLLDEPARAGSSGADPVDGDGRLRELQDEFDDGVLHALAELSDDARASLLLRVVLDLSYADIGQALGLPEGTVASHVHRARASLRARLARKAVGVDEVLRGRP